MIGFTYRVVGFHKRFVVVWVETLEKLDASFFVRDSLFFKEGIAKSEEMAVVSHDTVFVSDAGLGGDVHEVLKDPFGVARGR